VNRFEDVEKHDRLLTSVKQEGRVGRIVRRVPLLLHFTVKFYRKYLWHKASNEGSFVDRFVSVGTCLTANKWNA
jgi:hypothetical protein